MVFLRWGTEFDHAEAMTSVVAETCDAGQVYERGIGAVGQTCADRDSISGRAILRLGLASPVSRLRTLGCILQQGATFVTF